MNTPDTTSKPTGPNLLQILKTVGLLFLLGSFASCSSSPESASVPFQPEHWHKVSSNPPTYYPKGVPATHPTGFNDGYTISTGDSTKSTYFVPLRGVATERLVAEAMTRITAERQREFEKGDGLNLKGNFKKLLGGGILGMGNSLLELDQQTYQCTGIPTRGGAIFNSQQH